MLFRLETLGYDRNSTANHWKIAGSEIQRSLFRCKEEDGGGQGIKKVKWHTTFAPVTCGR